MEHPVRAELIYNPYSGQGAIRRELDDVITFLISSGWEVERWEVNVPWEAMERAANAARRGMDVVIAAGGDGTIHEVVNGLVDTDTALGVIPTGTTNAWALQMGIPTLNPMLPGRMAARVITDLETRFSQPLWANYFRKVLLRAAQVLVEGNTVAVDVGEIAGHYFLMWAGIGLDATVLEGITSKEKRSMGYLAYVIPALEKMRHYSCTDVTLTLDGKTVKYSSSLIVVSNIQLYGANLPVGTKALVDDGKLDVCVFRGDGVFTFMQHAFKVLSRRHLHDPKIDYHQCSRIEIDSARPLPVHTDAEIYTQTPVTISVRPRALKTIVPRGVSSSLFSQ